MAGELDTVGLSDVAGKDAPDGGWYSDWAELGGVFWVLVEAEEVGAGEVGNDEGMDVPIEAAGEEGCDV
eukprot:scaffold13088_cov33-Cyclotella_meneghiniana.AAC.6